MMWEFVLAGFIGGITGTLAQSLWRHFRSKPVEVVQEDPPSEEPPSDRWGVELGRVRTVEGMREAAAHVCRVISREAANKARISHNESRDQRLSEEIRKRAEDRQKAWLYWCEAAERCEREIRALGLR